MEKLSVIKLLFSKHFGKMLGLSIGIVIVLFLGVLLMLRIYTDHGEAFAVPDFYGLTEEELDEQVPERDLRYQIIDSLYVTSLPRGTVLDQYPKPGFKVKKDRMMFLTINAYGREEVLVPNVKGVSFRQARAIIENKGLELGKLTYVPDIAINSVLEQKIGGVIAAPGDTVFKGVKIDLVLGGGLSDTKTKVPNLIGLNLEQAENKLAEYSLNLGGKNYDNLPEPENDSIFPFVWKQKPAFDSDVKLKLGDVVDVWFTTDSIKLPGYDTLNNEDEVDLSYYFNDI